MKQQFNQCICMHWAEYVLVCNPSVDACVPLGQGLHVTFSRDMLQADLASLPLTQEQHALAESLANSRESELKELKVSVGCWRAFVASLIHAVSGAIAVLQLHGMLAASASVDCCYI